MKHLKPYILVCLLLLAMPMVAQQQWYFSVDEWYPAERSYLQGKQRILVVNNAITQPKDFGHTTIVDGENSNSMTVDLSRGILYCLFSATQMLEQSNEFASVELMDISQNPSSNYYSRTTLSHAKAEQLCADYQADALLMLNQLVLYDVVESFPTDGGAYYAYMQAYAQSHWTIHYAGQVRETTFTHADTLLWESSLRNTRANSLGELPARQEALLYLSQELGSRVGSSFAPSWQPERRYIYSMDELQAGLDEFRYQRWEGAIHHWQLAIGDEAKGERLKVKGKDKKAAAVATANIAIAYELLGDYSSACDYANEACRLFGALKSAWARQQQVNIRYYLEQLRAKKAREGAR